MTRTDDPLVITPDFKRRLSGATATLMRLVRLKARKIRRVATDHIGQLDAMIKDFIGARDLARA